MSRPFWHDEHLELPAPLAPVIRHLLEGGRREARVNGWLAGNRALTEWLHQLDQLAAQQSTRSPMGRATSDVTPPDDRRWLTTAEAAKVLDVSERRVRQMSSRIINRTFSGRLMWLEADVLEEADARREYGGSDRKPAEYRESTDGHAAGHEHEPLLPPAQAGGG